MPPRDAAPFLTAFGDAIRARRRELGLSQEALAAEAGMNRSYFADVERGTRNLGLANALRVARALDMPLSRLIENAEGLLGG